MNDGMSVEYWWNDNDTRTNRTKTCPIDLTWTGPSLLCMNSAMLIACFMKSSILDGVVPDLGRYSVDFLGDCIWQKQRFM